jgi:hypothetical protein
VATALISGLQIEGPWRWRIRSRDRDDNYSDWMDFGTPAADFVIDRTGPSTPAGLLPVEIDVQVTGLESGPVEFAWTPASDACPLPITYRIETAYDVDFGGATVGDPTTEPQGILPLPVSGQTRFWRVRAVDGAGNGTLSGVYRFRVVGYDGVNNSSGDAAKVMGCSAEAPGRLGMLGLLAAGALLAARRR